MKKITLLLVSLMLLGNFRLMAQNWVNGGNTLSTDGKFGTKSNHGISFITNNTLRGMVSNDGNWAFGFFANPTAIVHINSDGDRHPLSVMRSGVTQLVVHKAGGVSIGGVYTPPAKGLLVSGNVGIGTISPSAKLHVNHKGILITKFSNSATTGDRTALIDIQNGEGALWRYGVGGAGNGLGINNGQFYIEHLGTSPVIPLTLTKTGNVGIGTITPTHKLHVVGTEILSTGHRAGFMFRDRGSSTNADDWAWYSKDNIARFWRGGIGDFIRITKDGNVGIGTNYTADSRYKLVVSGKVRALEYWVWRSTGDIKIARLGNQAKGLSDALAKVQKIETISYGFEDEAATKQEAAKGKAQADQQGSLVFLPENLQEVFPALVMEDSGEFAINYQGMIPVLVEAVKELSLQKETLQAENLQMKQELTAMKQALQQHGFLSTGGEASLGTGSLLEQNRPNPFRQSTTISYQAPAQAQQVSLLITNLQGVEVQRFDNLPTGTGQVEVAAGSLAVATYVYTLVVDGKVIASQKMILTK